MSKNPDFKIRLVHPTESKLDQKLLRLICTALVSASMCWDSPRSAGQFDSNRALKIAETLKEDIKDLIRNK